MELLLILSALLSAFTGAVGVRAPEMRSHQTAARAVVRAVAATAPAVRPSAALPSLVDSAIRSRATALAPATSVPLYATRRRE